ncbi:bacterial low temperature requirement A protein-domain-containing protein [Sphaerosporella brunnea]|uniref:Bacterial low temperature requirement A protein-domain-containing protein n=1 Tax=Sphaerosporella brunnea TaxID=1250544 RepID=A0A5J5EBM5_9PEZI|nr:bacterial low temperature requirement A protein-domain-containing protein [Sphaerosporella brunnea]
MPPRKLHATTPDQQRLFQRKAQLLPWIANPLHLFLHHEASHGHAHQPLATTEGQAEHKHHKTSLSSAEAIYEEVEAEEAEPSELFYDLFFVANLTTITSVHYMTDYSSMVSYILFFILLWFTWLQTTLYDIRFTSDSLYERVIRSVHFAVMIAFASVSTSWNPLDPSLPSARNNLMSMSLTLMASRIALGIQYAVATVYASKTFKKGILPLVIHSVTMFAAGFAYLGLYFTFQGSPAPKTYIAWYGIILIEVFAVCTSSSIWNVLSFKHTHLVERLGLLTLIIIGEGIIVMLKAVNAVEKGSTYGRGWTASIFFIVACAVGILYLLYMFYFDYTPRNVHYGTIRQQFWAVLHFPFHLAIVLSVEGLRQLSTWWSFQQANRLITRRFEAAANSTDPQVSWENTLSEIQNFLQYLYDDGTAKDVVKNWDEIQTELANLKKTPYDSMTNQTMIDVYQLSFDMISGFAEFYGIKVPKSKSNLNPANQIMGVYNMVYTYFFSALAVVFFMYGILGLFVRRKKDIWDYFSVALRFAVAFTFIGLERMKANPAMYVRFMSSPWPIPTVAIILFVALFVDKVVGLFAYKRMHASMSYHR